jgi:hypothetical protein
MEIYRVFFNHLYSDKGEPYPGAITCDTQFCFGPRRFDRIDTWNIQERVRSEEYRLEVLQPAKHPHRPNFGEVHTLSVTWESQIEAIKLLGKSDVGSLPEYRNYHGHASHAWKIMAGPFELEKGIYTTRLKVQW